MPKRSLDVVTARPTERALDVLELLAESATGTSVSEVAERMHCHRSTASRLLATLAERGYVERRADGRYGLGLRILTLAHRALDSMEIRRRAKPYLQYLVKVSEETVNIAVLDGLEIVYIDRLMGTQPISLRTPVGARAPAHCTAIGKVLLAELPEEEARRRLSSRVLTPFTAYTVTNVEDLMRQLSTVRAQGYALNDREHREDSRCIAAPVRDYTGKGIAAISITAPVFRMSEERINELVPYLKAAAQNLSRDLGYAVAGDSVAGLAVRDDP
ncbi:IclR family transcriptional regulator [Geochorda subterranea]|uniref:IclR family transcriptional regulator n=1 Tax=Geochorda subterranea TaxID=3109564 RepID=A0ABZ1BRP8_9FIRM|nr:IclR family transcriptional regulator [Limnochorda sp. LNt]WRP15136.1 IclR family transcriptional regulator [Limnochorda sp. LNt]